MKEQLLIESDGNDGFIAYMPETPIVTYGATIDEVMNNVIALIDEYNTTNQLADPLSIGNVQINATDTDTDNAEYDM